jgi:hypothetical protein
MPRRSAAIAATLLFLAGTQFCLIGALAGLPMGCVELPSQAHAATSVPPCHAAPAESPDSQDTGGACGDAGSPCCLSAAPVETPAVHKSDATSAATLVAPVDRAYALPLPSARWSPTPEESPPPPAEPPAASLGRSPPLS